MAKVTKEIKQVEVVSYKEEEVYNLALSKQELEVITRLLQATGGYPGHTMRKYVDSLLMDIREVSPGYCNNAEVLRGSLEFIC